MPPRPRPRAREQARYHHGNLRWTLLGQAEKMLRDQGIEAFSLRRLAERSGVTAPALYHHFRDKNHLLCALAELGFVDLETVTTVAMADHSGPERRRMRRFVSAYVGFAADRPEIYDLMFGRTIWKGGAPTESLRAVAYGTFRRYVEHVVAETEPKATTRKSKRALRSAQVGWATVHGLCRLLIDGIYLERADLEAMSEAAVDVLLAASKRT